MSGATGVPRTVAIVGLGLIGGSIARDLASRGVRVIAYDRDAETVLQAQSCGVVSGLVGEGLAEAAQADVVVVATPVDEAHGALRLIARHEVQAGVVLDVGSTKSEVVTTATECGLGEVFVGSHPLAGGHSSGWHASRTGLFAGSRVFVCPTPHSRQESVDAASAFWRLLGARPERMDAHRHDQHIAWSSHLPQIVSAALGVVLRRAGIPRAELGPGGKDVTRLAGSSPDVWTPILLENAAAVVDGIRFAEEELRRARELVEAADGAGLAARLSEARQWFEVADLNGP